MYLRMTKHDLAYAIENAEQQDGQFVLELPASAVVESDDQETLQGIASPWDEQHIVYVRISRDDFCRISVEAERFADRDFLEVDSYDIISIEWPMTFLTRGNGDFFVESVKAAEITCLQYWILRVLHDRRSESLEKLHRDVEPSMNLEEFTQVVEETGKMLAVSDLPWTVKINHRKAGDLVVLLPNGCGELVAA